MWMAGYAARDKPSEGKVHDLCAKAIAFEDGRVDMKAGEMFVVPKGRRHRPMAEKECHIMVIEARGVVNTGEAGGEMTAKNDVWV